MTQKMPSFGEAQYSAKINQLHQRMERTHRWIQRFSRVENRFPWIRLAILALGIAGIFAAAQLHVLLLTWSAVIIFVGLFLYAASRHNALIEKIERLRGFQLILQDQAARITLNWQSITPATNIAVPIDHPYSRDLNIIGDRSLHQLIDTATSREGSHRLANWLLQPVPDPAAVRKRQNLVMELISKPYFRNCLRLDGLLSNPDPAQRWDTGGVLHWLERKSKAQSIRPLLIALTALALMNIILFGLNTAGNIPPLWLGSAVLYLGLQAYNFRASGEVFDEAYSLGSQLSKLRSILAGLESYPYAIGSALEVVASPIYRKEPRPSTAFRRVKTIISAVSLRNNPFLALLLNLLFPWDVFFAYQLELVKRNLRSQLPTWLDAWHEIEALSSIADYSTLQPQQSFPEMKNLDTQPVFEALEIGHPLIPFPNRVLNDFVFDSLGEFVLITGSNMSGKSTFLRTIGTNIVLALSGCPVTAKKVATIPFRLFTSMTVSDSLNDGISFFYAEVRRLKELLDALDSNHAYPLLFLIDEIFRGTNNRERQIGSYAYTQSLTGKHGVGLLSTHDLELTNLAKENPAIKNFNFQETIQDGQMVFDYKIHPGASPTTNALRIMALAGLPVPADAKLRNTSSLDNKERTGGSTC